MHLALYHNIGRFTLLGIFHKIKYSNMRCNSIIYNLNQFINSPMYRPASKSIVVPAQQQQSSYRSNRTLTYYNINDYLPPTAPSRITNTYKPLGKIYTQPNDRCRQQEVGDIRRRMELSEAEKESYRKQLQKMSEQWDNQQGVVKQKDQLIKQLSNQIAQLSNQLNTAGKGKCNVGFVRNNIHFIYYPKIYQRYEVSVQTDSIEVPSNLITNNITFSKKPSIRETDREMHEIEQKLSKLNPVKKPIKQRTKYDRLQGPKFQGHRYDRTQKSDAIFCRIDDKQNMMRLSNTFQRVATAFPEQKAREEAIEVAAVQNDQLERLIRLYMQ